MIHEQHYTDGVSCDATDCKATIRGDQLKSWPGRRHYQDQATAKGWTYWAGRTNREYCPDHGPQPGHKMRPIAGRPAGGGQTS